MGRNGTGVPAGRCFDSDPRLGHSLRERFWGCEECGCRRLWTRELLRGSLSSFEVIEGHSHSHSHPSHLASRVHAWSLPWPGSCGCRRIDLSKSKISSRIDRSVRQAEDKSWRRRRRPWNLRPPEHASSESAANQNSQRDVGGGARDCTRICCLMGGRGLGVAFHITNLNHEEPSTDYSYCPPPSRPRL